MLLFIIMYIISFFIVKESEGSKHETTALELLPNNEGEKRTGPSVFTCKAGLKQTFDSAQHNLIFHPKDFPSNRIEYDHNIDQNIYPMVISITYINMNLYGILHREEGCSSSLLTYLTFMYIKIILFLYFMNSGCDTGLACQVIKQKIHVSHYGYIVNEVFGLDEGKDCLICMSAPKNTILLPCRHICLCSECSMALRLQTNKCPVCRAKVESLLRIEKDDSGCRSMCSTPLPKIDESRLSEIYERRSRLSSVQPQLQQQPTQQQLPPPPEANDSMKPLESLDNINTTEVSKDN